MRTAAMGRRSDGWKGGMAQQASGLQDIIPVAPLDLVRPESGAPATDGAQTGPAWFRACEVLQRAEHRPTAAAVDVVLVAAAVLLLGGSLLQATAGTAAFALVGWFGPLYRRRSVVETQGVGWYLSALALPLLTFTAAVAASGAAGSGVALVVTAVGGSLGLVHALVWLLVARTRRAGIGLHAALLVGPPERTAVLAKRIDAYPQLGLRVAATLSPSNTNGQRSRARALLGQGAIKQVLITSDVYDEALIRELNGWRLARPFDIAFLPPLAAADSRLPRVGYLDVVPLGRTDDVHGGATKRLLDILLSALMLFLLAPVFAITSLAIYAYDRGPVFYRQRRVGRNNKEFTIFKFRSMVQGADKMTDDYADANVSDGLLFKLTNDPRVTPVGDLIRRLSIDELPQLINVLIGDMSLVGPRPLPVDPSAFDPVAAERHRVRPGITGPWQVAGGHVLGYSDMIKLDLAYTHSWSLGRDLWYLLMTIPAVLVRRSAAY